jgi:hypothetical protein
MFLNFKYPIIAFVFAFPFIIIGLLFKIQHWPGARLLLGSMFIVQAISLVWLIVIIIKKRKG